MTRSALILAAHGAGDGSAANRWLRAMAEELAGTSAFAEVVAAFHLGSPSYAQAVDALGATYVVVVPVMTSDGYYRQTVLPRGLARSRRLGQVRLAVTPALGTHPALPDLLARRAQRTMQELALEPRETALVVVGHGAIRHRQSRAATIALRDALRRRSLCARVAAAFLSDAPRVEDVPKRVTARNLLVIPFLIGGGYHASIDVQQRLGLEHGCTSKSPPVACFQRRRIVLIDTLGSDPAIDDLIRDLAARGYHALRAHPRRSGA